MHYPSAHSLRRPGGRMILSSSSFRKGLSAELQSELACRDEGKSLDQFIDLAIHIDNLVRSRRQPRFFSASAGMTSLPEPEPMQLGVTHLSVEERDRRMRQNLCLYCGLPGHLRASCPTRPPRNPSSVSKSSTISSVLEIPVTLRVKGRLLRPRLWSTLGQREISLTLHSQGLINSPCFLWISFGSGSARRTSTRLRTDSIHHRGSIIMHRSISHWDHPTICLPISSNSYHPGTPLAGETQPDYLLVWQTDNSVVWNLPPTLSRSNSSKGK